MKDIKLAEAVFNKEDDCLRKQIYDLLYLWRLHYLREECDEESGYPLVDAVTPKGQNIGYGQEELYLLADAIAGDFGKTEESLQQRVKELEEALRFYAHPNNHRNVIADEKGFTDSPVTQDKGKRAREVLK